MSEVFGHKYELYINNPERLVEVHKQAVGIVPESPELVCKPLLKVLYSDFESLTTLPTTDNQPTSSITGGYLDYLTIPANEAKVITDPIQMEAKVRVKAGSSKGGSPDATIKVYNLSQDTLDSIEADVAVILKAGYETDSELPVIFVGQIESVDTEDDGVNRITKLTCKEASNASKTATFARSYPIGYDYQFILLDLIEEFGKNGVPFGQFLGNERSGSPLQEGSTYSGKLSECLSEVCEEIDFVWYTCKGRLYVQPADEPILTNVITIEPSNVIERIHPANEKAGRSNVDRKAENTGIKLKTFLNGDITANTLIDVTYGKFEGNYRPTEIQHNLNWKHGPWQTTIKGTKPRNE